MGVKGLLPCLESITRQVSLEKYRGLTAAVDAMCWLHKGVFTGDVRALAKYQFRPLQQKQSDPPSISTPCEGFNGEGYNFSGASSMSMSAGEEETQTLVKKLNFDQFASTRKPRYRNGNGHNNHHHNQKNCHHEVKEDFTNAKVAMNKCVDYVIRHAELLRTYYGIEVVLVIDGGSLPCKADINKKRREDRAEAFEKGLLADKRGDSRDARRQYSRACSITYEMRHELITQCKSRSISFVVAPYEADAQVAKLAQCGVADFIISEDSDLLAYACPRVLFKLDFKSGKGDEVQVMRDLASNKAPSFRHWNHDMFVYMCILSGCDYCEGVPGVGIQTAHKLVRIHRSPSKIFNALRRAGKLPQNFEEDFWNAYRTFRHQRIYCPQGRVIETLFPIQESGDHNQMWEFLGPWVQPSIAIGIAEGNLHPTQQVPWDQARHDPQARMRARQNSSDGSSPEECIRRGKGPPSDTNLFAFFRSNKPNASNRTVKNTKNPPLREIRVDPNNIHHHVSDVNASVPSNFHDYSSSLVAESFEPLSRKSNPLRASQKRKGASKAFRKLKNRLSLKTVLEREKEKKLKRAAELRATSIINKSTHNHSESERGSLMKVDTSSGIFKQRDIGHDYKFMYQSSEGRDVQDKHDDPNNTEATYFDAESNIRFDYVADEYPSFQQCNDTCDQGNHVVREEYGGLDKSVGKELNSMLPMFENDTGVNSQQEGDPDTFAYDSGHLNYTYTPTHESNDQNCFENIASCEDKFDSSRIFIDMEETTHQARTSTFHVQTSDSFPSQEATDDHDDVIEPCHNKNIYNEIAATQDNFDYGSVHGSNTDDMNIQALPQCHISQWNNIDDGGSDTEVEADEDLRHDWEIFQSL